MKIFPFFEKKISHPFYDLCLLKRNEFNRRLNLLSAAPEKIARINEIIEETRKKFPKVSSGGVTEQSEKEALARHIVLLVTKETARKPPLVSTKARKLLRKFEGKLLRGARGAKSFERIDNSVLELAKIQLIAPFFGNDVRKLVKKYENLENELQNPDRALGLAAIHGSGNQDLANAYIVHGNFESFDPKMLGMLEEDLLRAQEVRECPPSKIKAAAAKLNEVYADRRRAADSARGSAATVGQAIERRSLEQLHESIMKKYPDFLHALTLLYSHSPTPKHAAMLADYVFHNVSTPSGPGFIKPGSEPRYIHTLAQSLEKQVGVSCKGTEGALNAVSALLNDQNLRDIIPKDSRLFATVMERLTSCFAENPTHASTAFDRLKKLADRYDDKRQLIRHNFIKHLEYLITYLEYHGDKVNEAVNHFKQDTLLPEPLEEEKPTGMKLTKTNGPTTSEKTMVRQRQIALLNQRISRLEAQKKNLLRQKRQKGVRWVQDVLKPGIAQIDKQIKALKKELTGW